MVWEQCFCLFVGGDADCRGALSPEALNKRPLQMWLGLKGKWPTWKRLKNRARGEGKKGKAKWTMSKNGSKKGLQGGQKPCQCGGQRQMGASLEGRRNPVPWANPQHNPHRKFSRDYQKAFQGGHQIADLQSAIAALGPQNTRKIAGHKATKPSIPPKLMGNNACNTRTNLIAS